MSWHARKSNDACLPEGSAFVIAVATAESAWEKKEDRKDDGQVDWDDRGTLMTCLYLHKR